MMSEGVGLEGEVKSRFYLVKQDKDARDRKWLLLRVLKFRSKDAE